MSQKMCFVIMGFGEKPDFRTSRTLNLDKTYRGIIKPAVEKAGFKCIRADEITHSGVIDVPMYEHLINADVVIADISTYNPNAIYELGVRHALRPHSTIVISESQLAYPFDINHTSIGTYEHLGKGIDFEEVERFKSELGKILEKVKNHPEKDSPVYTYLNNLAPPHNKVEINNEIIEKTEAIETLNSILDTADKYLNNDEFIKAKRLFLKAKEIAPNNDYIIQRIILTTYKSKEPNEVESLYESLRYLKDLYPDRTNDPETLGLYGSINKRLWKLTNKRDYLDIAIFASEKGFYMRRDYYNGINLAYLLNIRSKEHDGYERVADYVLANRVRKQVVNICEGILLDSSFEKREDKYWVIATLEEAYFGLKDVGKYNEFKDKAEKICDVEWMRKTTKMQLESLESLLNIELN